jgi:hypothetical protein
MLMPLGLLSQGGGASAGPIAFELISTSLINAGGTYSVDFTSISSSYTHLQLRIVAESNQSVASDQLLIKVNSVAAGNYGRHRTYSVGGSPFAAGGSGDSIIPYIPGSADGTNIFGFVIAEFMDYTNTNKLKTIRMMNGFQGPSGRWQEFQSGLYNSTSAITAINVSINSGYYFNTGTRLSLYGIKGS